ncbi:MAG: hydrogenase/urease maturation nickel metallochaperone HypA, partial [Candidatus Bathyarchaeia archaeon]
RLVIEEKEGNVRCSECGYEGKLNIQDDPTFHVPTPTLKCPKCGGTVKIVSGRDCVIKSVRMLV